MAHILFYLRWTETQTQKCKGRKVSWECGVLGLSCGKGVLVPREFRERALDWGYVATSQGLGWHQGMLWWRRRTMSPKCYFSISLKLDGAEGEQSAALRGQSLGVLVAAWGGVKLRSLGKLFLRLIMEELTPVHERDPWILRLTVHIFSHSLVDCSSFMEMLELPQLNHRKTLVCLEKGVNYMVSWGRYNKVIMDPSQLSCHCQMNLDHKKFFSVLQVKFSLYHARQTISKFIYVGSSIDFKQTNCLCQFCLYSEIPC